MCKCVIAILLADLLTLSLLYTAFIELNINDAHYNIINLLRTDYEFDGKDKALVAMLSYGIALLIHSLSVIIKWIYQLMCCCDFCCCSCGRDYDRDIIYV